MPFPDKSSRNPRSPEGIIGAINQKIKDTPPPTKEEILKDIKHLMFDPRARNRILQEAFTPNTELNKFFAKQRGFRQTREDSGSFKKLLDMIPNSPLSGKNWFQKTKEEYQKLAATFRKPETKVANEHKTASEEEMFERNSQRRY